MKNNFITINQSLINEASEVISKEFQNAPFFKYLFEDKDVRLTILPYIFNNLLNVYKSIGTTYITSINVEGTFSLVNFNSSNHHLSYYQSLIKGISNDMSILKTIDLKKTINNLSEAKETLLSVKDFIKDYNHYLFLSSIGLNYNSETDRLQFLNDMIDFCTDESKNLNIPILVETETLEMVKLYEAHGFILKKEFNIKGTSVTLFLLQYS
ncbi:MAG: hypothetical protein ACRCVJ_02735 [Clostridium sp.]|uniref:hypothetical protein n=1 Tax=Clostridium sp. TaxID=1506 RepID=UPI003F3579BB